MQLGRDILAHNIGKRRTLDLAVVRLSFSAIVSRSVSTAQVQESGMFLRPVVCPVPIGSDEVALILDPCTFWRDNSSRFYRSASTSSSSSRHHSTATDTVADLESLQKQLRLVDRRLATLTGRLEVLKAVQQVLPPGKLQLASHRAFCSNDKARPSL